VVSAVAECVDRQVVVERGVEDPYWEAVLPEMSTRPRTEFQLLSTALRVAGVEDQVDVHRATAARTAELATGDLRH
jgi:hypothetical protein